MRKEKELWLKKMLIKKYIRQRMINSRMAYILAAYHWYRSLRIVENYFNTRYENTVLISYIVEPFIGDVKHVKHTNFQEAIAIAKAFSNIGYNVDVINYNSYRIVNYKKYDVIFGFGNIFENSFYCNTVLCRIFYATGSDIKFQNTSEIQRVMSVNNRRNCHILPKRIVPYTWILSTAFSDAMIILGNTFTMNTYKASLCRRKFSLNATAFLHHNVLDIARNISETKNQFLWFGSMGLIHKGLDLCVEVFAKRKDAVLHICGPREEDFFEIYSEELHNSNIVFYGHVDTKSDLFIEIVSKCLFVILPSCSEGQSTSLLTAMAAGLIPIASRQAGICINELGVLIEELTVEGLENSINQAYAISEDGLMVLSDRNRRYVWENHNLDEFQVNIAKIIKEIVNV